MSESKPVRITSKTLLLGCSIAAAIGCARKEMATSRSPEADDVATGADDVVTDDAVVRVCTSPMPRVSVVPMASAEAGGAELEVSWLESGATDGVVVRWKGDLNADGRDDLITRVKDACGNWGECPFQVLVDCGAGATWAYVLPEWRVPVYAFDLDVGDTQTVVSGRSWTDLVEVERQGPDLDDPEAREPPPLEHRLRFDGVAYERSSP